MRGSEDRAQYFGDRAEALLTNIVAASAELLEPPEAANSVISSILLHIAFQGALPNADAISNALNIASRIVESSKRASELDPIMTQRVYAQMVGIQQQPEERWKYLNLALEVETACDDDDLQKRAFVLSNMAIMALVLSNSVNWFASEDQGQQEERKLHIKKVLAYLDDLDSKLTRFEIKSRSEGSRFYSESLIAGYRVILYSTRASIYTALQSENDSMMWFAKTIEAAKLLRESVQVPLLATALSLLYAIRLLQQMNQPNLLADGMSVLERVIKYYPALYMPWKILSGQISTVLGPGGPFGAISSRFDSTAAWLEDGNTSSSTATVLGIGDDEMDDDDGDDADDDEFAEDDYVEAPPPPKKLKRSQAVSPPPAAVRNSPVQQSAGVSRGRPPSTPPDPMPLPAPIPIAAPAPAAPVPNAPKLPPPLTAQQQAQFAQYQQAAAAAAMMRYNVYPTNGIMYGFNPAALAQMQAAVPNTQGPAQPGDMSPAFFQRPQQFISPPGMPAGIFFAPSFHPGMPPPPTTSAPPPQPLNSSAGSNVSS